MFAADTTQRSYVGTPTPRFAYRRRGTGRSVPLVLFMRLRGTIDHWALALLDVLASERDVIVLDNRGTGASTGTAPTSVSELAEGAIAFIEALGLHETDLLGWSMGGSVAKQSRSNGPTSSAG